MKHPFRRNDTDASARYTPRPVYADDLFLVTFPKSGTTWMAHLIANVVVAMNDIDLRVGISNVDGILPDAPAVSMMQNRLVDHFPGYRIFKCHSPVNPSFKRVVYVVRDPRDVMASFYKFQVGLGLFSGSISEFVRTKRYGIAAWVDHIAGWFERSSVDVSFKYLRYEDLKADPVAAIGGVFSYFGHDVPQAILHGAAERSTFAAMKQDEADKAYGGRSRLAAFSFFQRGEIRGFSEQLSPQDVTFIEDQAGAWMKFFSYQ